ncbi:MAG: sugar phosphate isomerase/epimerase [Lachnospiraceae bacterium]|nr:sugar phosphate isomerase/epimerase [Lachnospiraceae bacterium]
MGTFFHHIKLASAERGESLEKTLAWLRETGYEGAELDADDLDGTEYLKKQGIAASSIYRQYRWKDGIDEDRMIEHIRFAKELGSSKIMAIPGLFGRGGNRDEELKRMIEGMSRLSELAGDNGLILTIEDYDDALSPIATIKGMKVFLDAIPDLKVAFDTGNFVFSGDDVIEAGDEFFSRTVHVHLKDRLWSAVGKGDPKECPDGRLLWPCAVGEGDIPMSGLIDELKGIGYDGFVMAEFFGAASYSDNIKRSADYLLGRIR